MGTTAGDSSFIEQVDDIASNDGGQPVRHDDDRFVPCQCSNFIRQLSFRQIIERTGRLIEDQNLRCLIESARNPDSLFLPARQGDAAPAH